MHRNQGCPLPNTHRRLNDVRKNWHQSVAEYNDPEGFRANLNATIESLRNVTFMLQSEKDQIPNFDAWYEIKRNLMKADQLLSWLHNARTTVVHKEDLKKKSIAFVTYLNWFDQPLAKREDVDPFLTIEEIAINFAWMFSKVPDKNLREGVIQVERKWIVDQFPNDELMELIAEGYNFIEKIVREAHELIGVPFVDEIEKLNGSSLDKEALNIAASDRRVHISPSDGATRKMRTEDLKIPDEKFLKKVKKRYGEFPKDKNRNSEDAEVFARLDWFEDMAKMALARDGYHAPLMWLFYGKSAPAMLVIPAEDQADKYLQMRRVAARVEETNADGILFISEMWMATAEDAKKYPGRRAADIPTRTEGLSLVAASKGRNEARIIPFHRSLILKRITFGKTTVQYNLAQNWLNPIEAVWAKSI